MSDKLKEYIKTLVREMMVDEDMSTSGDVAGYLTPKAFAKKGQKSNGAIDAAEKEGFKKAPEGMPSDSKVKDYKAIWSKKKTYKIYKESDYDKASPSSNPSLYLQKSPYTSENMNEEEMKKGRRFIPPTLPFNEKLLEPFELSKTKEPIKLFKLVSKGEEYILLASPFVKNALESIERGRGSIDKDRQAAYAYSANLANYLKDNLNQSARVVIKKYLQNAKPGPGGYFPINLTVTKGKNGELLIKNPVFDTSSDIASPKYESLVGLNKQHQDKISDLSPEQKKALYNDLTDAVSDVNDMDFSGPTAKADYAKAMKNAKTKVYQKHNILESLSTIIAQELLNEVTYSKFKKDVSYRTKTEMLHKGIKEVKRKLAEIDRIVEYTSRMKQELSEGEEGIKYWKATEKNVAQIAEIVNTLNEKIKNLYQ
jgi:hypothetical protein